MEKLYRQCDYEFWGGIECTFNRVNDKFFDQLDFTGHYHRAEEDVERIASLGIQKLRYPLLWEYHQPEIDSRIDWRWATRQLTMLKENNITPIAGLVHHGSGPAFTNLLDNGFATGLADYASEVAKQFPWLEYYTPVNEPLTTARFSGLYGFWYPHERKDIAFMRMLINQLKGIVLAMREIRKINPHAKLVQTEDLGKTHSVPKLKYQADFENERRWLTYELLCGKVNRQHYMWGWLRHIGLTEREILFFEDNPCIPDIAGFNYYLTSERFLDDQVEYYPRHLWGGNHRHRYVDTEAIRIDHPHASGLFVLLKEAWERLKLPMAVTEGFLSCTEDEQVRWLNEVCMEAKRAKDSGVDLRAVTFWALLGEFSWNTLVTSMDGEYESGAFNVRGNHPQETLIAKFIRDIIASGSFDEEWIHEHGWWKKGDRFHVKESCINK
jgi:dTDP-4-dehydrorhamnose reductase